MPRPQDQKLSKARAAAMQRDQQALTLRQQGLAYPAIARAMGCSLSTAYAAVLRGLQRLEADLQERAADVRRMELQRLDVALAAIMPQVEAGEDRAVATMLRIMDRRARYLGLDEPERTEVQISAADPREILAGRLAGIAARAGADTGDPEPDT